MVDKSAFDAWFDTSKVLDESGNALVVYHGTKHDFNAFSSSQLGASTQHRTAKAGHFFTADASVASWFAGQSWDGWPLKMSYSTGAQVMPVFLSVGNPVQMPAQEFYEKFVRGSQSFEAFADEARQSGHDGVLIQGDPQMSNRMGGQEYAADVWVVFSPEQIKSALGNRGAFDASCADIRFSLPEPLQWADQDGVECFEALLPSGESPHG